MGNPSQRTLSFRTGLRWALILGVTAGLLWIAWLGQEDIRRNVIAFLEWVDGLGYWAPILFVAAVATSMLLFLPGLPFTMGAGFLFGPLWGTLYVLIGISIGGTWAFLAGRYIFSGTVERQLEKRETLRRFVAVLTVEGWRFVMITRMVPFFPFKLSNFVFGTTALPYRQFLAGTIVGIIPITVMNVYAGSLVGSVATIGDEGAAQSTYPWEWYLVGFGVALCFVLYVTRLARKSLEPYVSDEP